ncbi:hypothetical protein [Holospora curviuscula]|uniref:Uncharacterized protein n=1 Tax=Holospora curviuscula TaxID=1082868 RepID=A0A2S5R789_9PROT|nr:hypothetical protein [Holospora curviuscula]PPE03174.1 hypothetical protein HCUR_01374 [Holospora curviuscula]
MIRTILSYSLIPKNLLFEAHAEGSLSKKVQHLAKHNAIIIVLLQEFLLYTRIIGVQNINKSLCDLNYY